MFNPRRRKRSAELNDSEFIKKPKYAVIKWYSNLNLHVIDQQILYKTSETIKNNSSDMCFDIAKTISEYALGWIKVCPTCDDGEILIIPSRLWYAFQPYPEFTSPIICQNCTTQLYIHKCNSCSISPILWVNGYSSESWWLYHESITDTKYVPLPESNTCKDCVKDLHPDMLTLYRMNLQCEELCSKCVFECGLCNNQFCKRKHLGYYCFVCDLCYCSTCQHYFSSNVSSPCINCFRDLQKYASYYPNLQDRLLFDNYLGILVNHDEFLSTLYIPLNIVHCVVSFIDGMVMDCSHCTEGIGHIFPCEVYNHRKYIDQQFKCNFGHINYIHYCDNSKCSDKFIINSISCLKYIAYATPAWIRSVSKSDIEIIRENICHTCYTVDDKVITLCNDAKCSSICNECGATSCKEAGHSVCCVLCSEEYCINHSDWIKHQCRICGHAVCPECKTYCDDDLGIIECYYLYGVCYRDFSPYLNQFCEDPCEYIQCLDIFLSILDSNIPFTVLEEWNLIYEIVLYAR